MYNLLWTCYDLSMGLRALDALAHSPPHHDIIPILQMKILTFKVTELALAGVAQWIECQLVNQRVVDCIPSQGTCLGCRPCPSKGRARGNHTLMFLSLSPSLLLSLKINK